MPVFENDIEQLTYPTVTPKKTPPVTPKKTTPYKPWTPRPIAPPAKRPLVPRSLTGALGNVWGNIAGPLGNMFGNIPGAVGQTFGQGASAFGNMFNTYFRAPNSSLNPTSEAYEHQQRLNNQAPTPYRDKYGLSAADRAYDIQEKQRASNYPGIPTNIQQRDPLGLLPSDYAYDAYEQARALLYTQTHNQPVIINPPGGPGGPGGGGYGNGGGGGVGRGWQYGLVNWRIAKLFLNNNGEGYKDKWVKTQASNMPII